jgi:hypothetical protein
LFEYKSSNVFTRISTNFVIQVVWNGGVALPRSFKVGYQKINVRRKALYSVG